MSSALAPTLTRPARLAPLAKLPVFLDLGGRRAVVIGGSEPVVWKVELLLAAGAHVHLLAQDPHQDLLELARSEPRLRLDRRDWRPGDLDGAALVVAGLPAGEEAGRIAAAARARGLPVNVIDQPGYCSFQFGTVVNRSPVVIGISTDGAAPILGQALRRRIEAILPSGLGGWARTAKSFRERLLATLPERADRRRFWERFVDIALTTQGEEGTRLAELERVASEMGENGSPRPARIGEVVVVGAGPGDPELLTLKGMRELQAADVIVYDRLVTPAVLELGRREARRVLVGKEGHGASCRQDEISALLVDLALAGERVVRLKGGDPAIFGRTGEEVAACREAGVPVRIVPGVTTASAAAAALTLSLTHRDHAGRVHFVTGHDRRGALPADLDGHTLGDPRSTLVVYMAARTAPALATRLLSAGRDPETPVVAMSDVSRPNQASMSLSLADLTQGPAFPEGRPLIILIGAAVGCKPPSQTATMVDQRADATGETARLGAAPPERIWS
jgi:uroporphyrin-III C-methyltransferase/precorrin-2 dehydrogenase/sirohydrochlorin ferrochelatase